MTVQTICRINDLGVFLGETQIIDEEAGCPLGWVRAPAPELYEGQVAILADGYWIYALEAPIAIEPVPQRISMLQATLALIHYGRYDAVDTAIRNSGNTVLLMYWTKSTEGFERSHPSIDMVRIWMGWSNQEMDDMFRLAITLR